MDRLHQLDTIITLILSPEMEVLESSVFCLRYLLLKGRGDLTPDHSVSSPIFYKATGIVPSQKPRISTMCEPVVQGLQESHNSVWAWVKSHKTARQ